MKDIRYIFFYIILVIFSFQVSCKQTYHQNPKKAGIMVTRKKALDLAKDMFKTSGFGELGKYIFTVEEDDDELNWIVFVESNAKYPVPGDHAIIYVDKKTGKCEMDFGE